MPASARGASSSRRSFSWRRASLRSRWWRRDSSSASSASVSVISKVHKRDTFLELEVVRSGESGTDYGA